MSRAPSKEFWLYAGWLMAVMFGLVIFLKSYGPLAQQAPIAPGESTSALSDGALSVIYSNLCGEARTVIRGGSLQPLEKVMQNDYRMAVVDSDNWATSFFAQSLPNDSEIFVNLGPNTYAYSLHKGEFEAWVLYYCSNEVLDQIASMSW